MVGCYFLGYVGAMESVHGVIALSNEIDIIVILCARSVSWRREKENE